jgi:hypothetical protein
VQDGGVEVAGQRSVTYTYVGPFEFKQLDEKVVGIGLSKLKSS